MEHLIMLVILIGVLFGGTPLLARWLNDHHLTQ